MIPASWNTASSDVKTSIISQADPPTVRSICQIDDQTKQICQNKLPPQVKYRSCLDSEEAARECDKIPMFSEKQFRSLIPAQIAIIPDDPLQLTHEFYSQNYKLPNEGYSEALRKAKIINTLCALIRPQFLLEHSKEMSTLPAYLDAGLIDTAVSIYQAKKARVDIVLKSWNSIIPGAAVKLFTWNSPIDNRRIFDVSIATPKNAEHFTRIDDEFVSKHYKVNIDETRIVDKHELTFLLYKAIDNLWYYPNNFIISRIIYDLLNKGFINWSVVYMEDFNTEDPSIIFSARL